MIICSVAMREKERLNSLMEKGKLENINKT